MNRYVHVMCISIFFVSLIVGQDSSSKKLRDSLETLDIYPDDTTALSIFKRINQLSKKEGNRDTDLNSKLYMSHFHFYLGNKIEANEELTDAFEFAQDTTGIKPENIILAYQLMQDLERRRGNLTRANDLNKKYIEFEIKNGANDVQLGISYLEMASGLRILGDLENVILYSTKSFELFKNAPDTLFGRKTDKNYRLFKSLQFRGLAYKDMVEYPKAIQDYEESLRYLRKSAHLKKPIGIKSSIDGYNRISDAFLLNGDLAKASESLKKLSYLIKNESYEKFRYFELSAVLALKNGNTSSAAKNIQKAIELANIELKGNQAYPSIARLYMIYGDYFIARDLLSQALKKYHQGLQYFDTNLDDKLSNNPNISLVPEGIQPLQLLNRKAEILMTLYQNTEDNEYLYNSISTYNAAISLIDKMKSDFINEGSKYRVNDIASSIFPKALEANYILYEIEKSESSLNSIFKIIEKNKAEILFQNINSKYSLIKSSLPEDLIKKGVDLKYNISYYSKVFSEESLKSDRDKNKIKKYEDKLFKLKEALTFHDQNIKDNYPEFFKFIKEIDNQLSISDLQNILKKEEIILEYFQTENYLYTLSIAKDKVGIKRIPMSEVAINLINYFQQISQRPDGNSINPDALNNLSFSLAKQLIFDDTTYQSEYNKIIIIQDGILSRIPFETLVINDSGKMLIEASNVTYNYSASQYFENINSPIIENPEVLCLTPSFDGYRTEERNCNTSDLGDLPYAKREFEYLKENFSGLFLESDLSNFSNLKENFSDFQIIHLATHACLNNDDPMLSQIYFSDGAITNYDIQNLNSRPELVVLSACNTASGQIKEGEGVIGLSRGFFEAGVRGLQSSLWSIDDYSSSEIVQGMYHHLKNGKAKSEALRLSKLEYLKTADKLRSHPYYWSALIHIGNDNRMIFSNNTKQYWIFSLLFLTLILIGLYFYFK